MNIREELEDAELRASVDHLPVEVRNIEREYCKRFPDVDILSEDMRALMIIAFERGEVKGYDEGAALGTPT